MSLGRIRYFMLILAILASLFAVPLLPGIFRPIEYTLNDWQVRLSLRELSDWLSDLPLLSRLHLSEKTPPSRETRIIIVDVDERSLAEQGAWPWPREKIAALLKILMDDYAVSAVALDMVFPEPRENDDVLSLQLLRPQVTGAIVYDMQQRDLPELASALPAVPPMKYAEGAPLIFGLPVTSNHPGIMPLRAGHITPVFDEDGSIRHLPPLICQPKGAKNCRPIISLAAFAGLLDGAAFDLHPGTGWRSPSWELAVKDSSGVSLASIPLNSEGLLTVPYRHVRSSWTAISASDVLNRKIVDPSLLRGGLVLLGATALGMSDVVATPISPVAAGIEPHAEVFSALLDNDFPVVAQYGLWLDAALLIPFALLLHAALKRYIGPGQRAAVFPLWLAFTWLVTAIGTMLAYRSANLLLPLTPFLIFPPLAILFTLSAELYFAGHERAGVFSVLAAYLPRQVATRLTAGGPLRRKVDTSIDATRKEITVLFADIRGFTGLTEGQEPEIVVRLMQRIFTEMSEAVVNHHGTIDKFIGDAVMAFWNAPDDDARHAEHAVAAAEEILQKIRGLDEFCKELGVPPVSVGIGIETGSTLVGNFGSINRRTYTALGEPVVLASRIEGLTISYERNILIGEGCAAALGYANLKSLGSAKIRGRLQPLMIYSPEPGLLEKLKA